ncbi:MAG: isochorismate synthase [Bacteroidota bacterium]
MMERRDNIQSTLQVTPVTKPSLMLSDQVRSVLAAARNTAAVDQRIVQVSVPVAALDPVQWLREQDADIKIFWEARDDQFFTAALGEADQLIAQGNDAFPVLKAQVNERLEEAQEGVRYYGGIRFDQAGTPEWPVAGNFCFVLPRFELQGHDGQFFLCCNLIPGEDMHREEELLAALAGIQFSTHKLRGEVPLPIARHDSPNESGWRGMIQEALKMIRNGHPLEKVVLARKVEFSFTEAFDKFLLFKLLREATPNCFHFYFQVQDAYVFLGAPPERLYRRNGRAIFSEAVAGTGMRDDINAKDIELGHRLLLSDKDQHEHAFVRRSIEQVFRAICTDITMDKAPSLMNLNIGRHLRSKFHGMLRPSISDVDILQALPPTSAVGGHPKKEAMETIRQLESFDRGWYAGPIGWMSNEAAEFAVAIRSGLATDRKLALYSGAGIVEGSKPVDEWQEIEQKIGDFIKALGLDQRRAKY